MTNRFRKYKFYKIILTDVKLYIKNLIPGDISNFSVSYTVYSSFFCNEEEKIERVYKFLTVTFVMKIYLI